MRVRYFVDGLGEVEHDLLAMAERALEPGPVLRLIGKGLQQREAEAFATGGFGQWAPLSPSTIAAKGHDTILVDTGDLMASLTEEGAEGALFEVNGSELHFGTNLTSEDGTYYPGLLRTGTSRMPARDPLPELDESDLLLFSKAIQTYIVGVDRAEFGVGSWSLGSLDPFGL